MDTNFIICGHGTYFLFYFLHVMCRIPYLSTRIKVGCTQKWQNDCSLSLFGGIASVALWNAQIVYGINY